MKTLLTSLGLALVLPPMLAAQDMKKNPTTETVLFDFAQATSAIWQIVNDDVMGGVSSSTFGVTHGVAVFHGDVSLARNGGFASVRTLPMRFAARDASAFVLRVRGDGRRYKFTARPDANFDGPLYQSAFTTGKDEWQEIRLPLKDFVPTFRGRTLTNEPQLTTPKLASLGFLISDQQAGRFRLEIAWIKTISPNS
jgi:monofunctional biosynthetic peptidoglycan transglycosylase